MGKSLAFEIAVHLLANLLPLRLRDIENPGQLAFHLLRRGEQEHVSHAFVATQNHPLTNPDDTDVGVVKNQALLIEQAHDPRFGLLAFGDVGVGGDKAAIGQGRTLDFKHRTIRAGALKAVGFGVAGPCHRLGNVGFDIDRAIFAALGVETDHAFQGNRPTAQVVRQIQEGAHLPIALGDV